MASVFGGLFKDVGLQTGSANYNISYIDSSTSDYYSLQRRGFYQQMAPQQHQLDALGYATQWTGKELASMKRDEDDFIFLNVQEEVKLHNSLFED